MAKTAEKQLVPDIAPVKLNIKKSIPVHQFGLDGKYLQTFPSQQKASNATGATLNGISNCINGKAKTAGGFQWRKVENV